MHHAFEGQPEVPISRAVRAGSLVFTSAYGPWTFDPTKVVHDAMGRVASDGSGLEGTPFEEQVHRSFGFVAGALGAAGCDLADVVRMECWIADPRDFVAFNQVYATYFPHRRPVRSVFPSAFLFACKVEMQATAWRPTAGA